MPKITDRTLTHDGLAPGHAGPVLIIACGALAREILTLKRLNHWDHIDLACLPAILHNRPERIAPAVEEAVARHSQHYEKIVVAYADCGTGGQLQVLCDRLGVEMMPGPHCYATYRGTPGDDEADMRSFFLTDFLVRQFDAFVWKPLGLDRHPELRESYFGQYERLVHLAQSDDTALDAAARTAARRLGLAFERRFTGLGGLNAALAPAPGG